MNPGESAATNYLRKYTLNPGPEFYSNEYLLLHPDVAANKMNPLFHYEQWGWKEKRAISLADFKPYKFPDGTETVKVENFARDSKKHKMVSVFASFSGDGKIADYVVYLLKNLKTVSDYIIFVADNPIFKEELLKIIAMFVCASVMKSMISVRISAVINIWLNIKFCRKTIIF